MEKSYSDMTDEEKIEAERDMINFYGPLTRAFPHNKKWKICLENSQKRLDQLLKNHKKPSNLF